MPLTPEEIEHRTFALAELGYDRGEVRRFLIDVAATVAASSAATGASFPIPSTPTAPTGSVGRVGGSIVIGVDADAADPAGTGDPFGQIGAEVAAVLRAAQDAAAALRADAEADAAARRVDASADADATRAVALRDADAIRADAERDAADTAQRADAEATAQQDRARRLLVAAKEQADAIVAEAEAQARALLMTAREQAEQHRREVAARARAHAEDVLRVERDALRRLHEAQSHLTDAVDLLRTAEHRPVVDLTESTPTLRLGNFAVPGPDDPAVEAGVTVRDPLAGMVRAAVDRAVEASGRHREGQPAGV